jgi:hypothetical protein
MPITLNGTTGITTPGLTNTGTETISSGTANGVTYLNASKVLTSGSSLTFDGSNLGVGTSSPNSIGGNSNAKYFGVSGDGALNSADGRIILVNPRAYASIAAGSTTAGRIYFQLLNGSGGAVTDGAYITGIASGSGGASGYGVDLGFYTKVDNGASSQRMLLDASGNLGIGTSSPVEKLQVSGGGLKVTGASTAASGSGAGVYLNYVSGSNYGEVLALDQGVAWKTLRLNAGDIQFYIAGGEQMRLNSSGNLGIGTTSPGYKLTVAGASGSAVVSLLETGVRSWGIRAGGTATNTFDIADFTAGATRLTIDSSGNLGLGVTPSAWYSTFKAFQFGGYGSSVFGRSENNSAGIASNAYVDSAGNWKYINSNYASYYQQLNGAHAWYYAASGTAGNAITFTQVMSTDTSARLTMDRVADSAFTVRLTGNQDYFGIWASNGVASGGSGTSKGRIGLYYDNNLGNENGAIEFTRGGTATDGNILFRANGSERARITSGGLLLVGTTTAGYGLFTTQRVTINPNQDGMVVAPLSQNFSAYTVQGNNDTGTRYAMYIANGSSTAVGNISFTSSATAYNTSSDRRLKENVAQSDDAGSLIDAIEVVKHDWKVGGHVRYGVIAQDLHDVVPEAVTVGDSEDVEALKNPWGVDYSKLVPMLVKEIQSLRARLAAAGI